MHQTGNQKVIAVDRRLARAEMVTSQRADLPAKRALRRSRPGGGTDAQIPCAPSPVAGTPARTALCCDLSSTLACRADALWGAARS